MAVRLRSVSLFSLGICPLSSGGKSLGILKSRVAYISAAMTCVWQVRSEKREWGWGARACIGRRSMSLFRLFSRGLKGEKRKGSTGDEGQIYKQQEDKQKNYGQGLCGAKTISFPLPWGLNIARFGASFIRGMAERWCGRSLPCKCGLWLALVCMGHVKKVRVTAKGERER